MHTYIHYTFHIHTLIPLLIPLSRSRTPASHIENTSTRVYCVLCVMGDVMCDVWCVMWCVNRTHHFSHHRSHITHHISHGIENTLHHSLITHHITDYNSPQLSHDSVCFCVCVFVCVCVCVCICVFVRARMSFCRFVLVYRSYVCLFTYLLCLCVCISPSGCQCVYVCLRFCVSVFLYVSV